MRISWKDIADNMVVQMSREQMQAVYDRQKMRLNDPRDIMSPREEAAARQTLKYMGECITEYDMDFGDA